MITVGDSWGYIFIDREVVNRHNLRLAIQMILSGLTPEQYLHLEKNKTFDESINQILNEKV